MIGFKDNISGNISTATILQTARTINGTSFNGSANITTANWGTARTITIGSTGKSVNGSGNVNWTLAEIGAAKAYTSANGYEGITLSDGTTTNWLRTTSNGIIPYQSGGSGSLGTSSWPFNTVYAKTLYENGTALSSKYAAASHTHSYIPLSGSTAITGLLRSSGELQSTSANAFRSVYGNYGFIIRNDGSSTYFLLTASGDQYGSWNSLRPLYIENSTGLVVFGNGLKGSLTGNATTATTLQTARTLTIGSTGKSFNGGGNVSWSLSEIGAAAALHSHNYLDVKGTNTISSPTNDTTSNWGAQGNSVHFYTTAGCLKNQPDQWGYLLNIGQGAEVHQVWMTQATGNLLHRGGNGNGWSGSTSGDGSWRTILDSSNYSDYAISKSASCNKNWNWNGQPGQPTWLWGGYDGTNMYVYNPANFSVAWATGAGYSNEWRSTTWNNCYLTTGNGDGASWSTHNTIFRSHWGIGFRDYTDTCNFLIDTRLGNVFAKGYFMGTAFNTSSDKRLKEDIKPIDTKLEKMFMDLKPVSYYMINQADYRRHNGFIAQEVEESMLNNNISYEEFAGLLKRSHKNENTTEEDIPLQILNDENDEDNIEYSLNYNEFTALNTHMIQKCINIINEQSDKIQMLENKIQILETLV